MYWYFLLCTVTYPRLLFTRRQMENSSSSDSDSDEAAQKEKDGAKDVVVKTLLPSEQAMSLGVQVGDMITSVGNIRVPSGPTGLAFVTKAMKTQKRPVRVVCARADDGPMHTLKLTFEAGGLSWVLGRDRGMHCHVVAVRSGKKAGQASHLGARRCRHSVWA